MAQILVRALKAIEISGRRVVPEGETCYLGPTSFRRLSAENAIEVLEEPPASPRSTPPRPVVSARPTRLRVVVRGPFEWQGRRCHEGEILYLPPEVYRRYRSVGSLEREFVRKTFRGVPYLHAVTCGGRPRRGNNVETRGSCREHRRARESTST